MAEQIPPTPKDFLSRRLARFSSLACLVALSATPVSAEAQCHLEGISRGTAVQVNPGNGLVPFTVWARDHHISVDRGREVETIAELEGALAFEGNIAFSSLQLQVLRPGYYGGGVLYLSEGAALDLLHASDDSVEVQMYLGRGGTVRVTLPCTNLGIGESEAYVPGVPRDGTRWRSLSGPLDVWASPDSGEAALTLEPGIMLEGVAERGRWRQVITQGEGGYVLGWVRSAALARVTSLGRYASVPRIRSDGFDHYAPHQGLAIVRPGTPVSAAEAADPWATTVGIHHYIVRARPGEEWVRLVRILGLSDDDRGAFDHAWVPRESITYLHVVPRTRLLTPRFAESSIPTAPSIARPQPPTFHRPRQ